MAKFSVITVTACILLSAECFSDSDLELVPSNLEAFAKRLNVQVVQEREIARFAHEESQVTITAIILEHEDAAAARMHGLKVDLTNDQGADRVYLDAEGSIQVLIEVFRLQGVTRQFGTEGGDFQGRSRTTGTGSYWCFRPRPVVHTLCPEVYRFGDTSGVSLRTTSVRPTHLVVRLPNIDLGDLGSAVISGWLYLFEPRVE